MRQLTERTPITDGLVAWWPMEEGSGLYTNDYIGINRGQFEPSSQGADNHQWSDGKIGTGINLLSGESINISWSPVSNLLIESNNFSVGIWVKFISPASSSENLFALGCYDGFGVLWSIGLYGIQSESKYKQLFLQEYMYENVYNFDTESFLELNTWYYITWVVSSGIYQKVYINGALVKTFATTGTIRNWNHTGTEVRFGKFGSNSCNCMVDDTVIYNRVLSSQEVFENYILYEPLSKSGLIHVYNPELKTEKASTGSIDILKFNKENLIALGFLDQNGWPLAKMKRLISDVDRMFPSDFAHDVKYWDQLIRGLSVYNNFIENGSTEEQ